MVKFSNNYYAKINRIKNLPSEVDSVFSGLLKKNAANYIKAYQMGLKYQMFGLKKLSETTIAKKIRLDMPLPEAPLYGFGELEKNSMYNAIRIKKIKNGWKAFLSKAKHHRRKNNSDIDLKKLMIIHNNGALIKRGKSIIRIWPRPVLNKAYEKMMRTYKNEKRETSLMVKKAIAQYIENNNKSMMINFKNYQNRFKEIESET